MGNCVHLHGGGFEKTGDGCLPVQEGAGFPKNRYRRYEKSQGVAYESQRRREEERAADW